MARTRDDRWPRIIGTGLAYVQHGIDTAVKVSAAFVEGVAGDKNIIDIPPPKSIGKKAVAAGKNLLRFIGRTGRSYFEEYEKLKSRQ